MQPNSARVSDQNGFMLIRGCPLSREGVYEYAAKQVYPAGHPNMGDPDRIIGVYRPDSAIREPEAIESFKSIPFIDEHEMLAGDPDKSKYPDDAAPEDKGIDGVLTDNVYYDENDGWLKGDIKAFSRKAQETINNGKDNLSLGFNCKFKIESGEFGGKPYEVVQYHLRGNHLANVDEARVEGARILDARCFDSANLNLLVTTQEVSEMPKPIKGRAADSALDQLKALVPALQNIIQAGEQGGLDCSTSAQDDNVDNSDSTDVSAAPAEATADVDVPEDNSDQASSDDNSGDASDGVVAQAQALLQQIQALLSQQGGDDQVAVQDEDDSNADDTAQAMDDATMKEERQTMDENEIIAKAEDSALRRFRADEAAKHKMYDRLSNVVGAFDHRAMDSKSVAQYGLKKLKLSAAPGQEAIVLNSYLDGLSAAQKQSAAVIETRAADAAVGCDQINQWLKEGAK